MTMKNKLTVGFSIMAGIITLVVFINLVYVHSALELSHRMIDSRTLTANHSMTMLNGVNQALAALRGWVLLGQEAFKEERHQVWSIQLEAPLREMKKLSANGIHPENVERLKKIEALLPKFKQFQLEIENIAQTPDNRPALKMFLEQAVPQSNLMSNNITLMIDLEVQEKASPERKALLGLMADVRGTLGLSLTNLRAFLLSGKLQFQAKFEALWLKNEMRFNELARKTNLLTSQQFKAFELLTQTRNTFITLISQIMERRNQPNWNLSNYWLATKAAPLGIQLVKMLEEMAIHQQQLLQHDGKEIDKTIDELIQIEWYLLAMGILLAGFFGWFMIRDIFQQVGGEPAEIAQVTEQVAVGNLDLRFEASTTVATGIYASVQNMVKALKEIVEQIKVLAQGDYSVQIVPRSSTDILSHALVNLTTRLRDITNISEAIVAGDYSRQIESKGDNDLLGHAINQMTKKLHQVTDESQKLDWLKTGQTELNERMRGEQNLMVLTQSILHYLAAYLNAQVGVFFLAEDEHFKLFSSYAYKTRSSNYNEFKLGEGLVGQAALEKRSILFTQVPETHINLSINSGMGESLPHDIFVLPLIYEDQVLGVLELASSRHFTPTEIELLDRVANNIAVCLNSAQSRLRVRALLEESQQLTQNLQDQQEELLEREERIHAIVDTVLDALITIDEQGIIDTFNQAAEQIFGYTWSEVVGQNVKMLMPEPYHSEHDQYLQNYLRTGHANLIGQPRELVGQRKDGYTFPIDLAVSEMIVGEQRLFTGIIRDITERKKAENALREQREELQTNNEELQTQQEELAASNEELNAQQEELRVTNIELEERTHALENSKQDLEEKAQALELSTRYKSEFLANMSHELRTPLNSLLILSQLLADNKNGNLTNKQVEYARTINNAGSELLSLINDILDLSKVEAGKMEVHAEDVSLADFMETIEHKFRHVANDKGLALAITVADDLPTVLYTDVQRLTQILNNLISNALKFTAKGEIKLIVQRPSKEVVGFLSEIGLETAKTIAINVSDTGIGIPKEKQETIFEAFKQADGSTSRRYGGTGLGLSISRRLSQLLGGDLQLFSEEGKGSTFALYLPDRGESEVQQFNSSEVPPFPAPAQSQTDEVQTAILSNETMTPTAPNDVMPAENIIDDRNDLTSGDNSLLIIEDDRKFSMTLMELAREKDFKCLIAEDGKAGLQLAEQYQPHAIILDVGLPQMDGWTVMEKLKDNPKTRHIPVHFMSADEQERDAKKMGAIGYLLKPINMKQLGDAFQKIERFITNTVKHILIVVDNESRQQKMLDLVESVDVQPTVAVTMAEALQQLHTTLFDCIVLDLDIEQGIGIQFLEQLRHEEELSQIPVIIYAERDLTQQEDALLQRYDNNLTVKAVKSPERLLDETTLFLHQVEAHLSVDKRDMLRIVHDKEAILKDKKVLVVDDDTRNLFALVTVLEDKDMEVVVGKNGVEALQSLEEHSDIDLVLMDIMMPEMDGYEAMQEIRKQSCYRKLPIIALTAKAMKSDKAKCIEAGANDYLAKPVDTDKLISLMRVWLYR